MSERNDEPIVAELPENEKVEAEGKIIPEGQAEAIQAPAAATEKAAKSEEKEPTAEETKGQIKVSKPKKEDKVEAPEKEAKGEKEEKEEEEKVVEEKTLIINLRHAYLAYSRKQTPRSVKLVRKIASRAFKTEDVKIDNSLNNILWLRGKTKAQRRVSVKIQKLESGTVRVMPAPEA